MVLWWPWHVIEKSNDGRRINVKAAIVCGIIIIVCESDVCINSRNEVMCDCVWQRIEELVMMYCVRKMAKAFIVNIINESQYY